MTTQDLENAAELLKIKADNDTLQELNNRSLETSLWKPYRDAIEPVKHRLCVKDLKIDDRGIFWHKYPDDYSLSIKVMCGLTTYHYSYNGGDGFAGGSRLTKEQFEYEITKLCAAHLKSEEEVLEWHKKNDLKPVVKLDVPVQETIVYENMKLETSVNIIEDFVKFLLGKNKI